jgi:hypothetical protein
MLPRRLALLALLGAALLPCVARAAIPVAIYPFRVPGLSSAQRIDLTALLDAGLASAARRGVLAPRSPVVLRSTCGDAPAPACLGAAAKEGLVLTGRGELKGGVVLVSAVLHDRTGARTREVRFVVDLVIQNLRPIGEAIAELELEVEPDGLVTGSEPPPPASPVDRGPLGSKPAVAAAPAPPPATVPAPKAPAAAAPGKTDGRARLDVSAPAAKPASWKRQAGPLFTVVGAGLLAGGTVVGYLDKRLADDLEAKRAAGTLSPADRPSYDRVDRYNVLSTVLLAAGGVSAAAGAWLWISAPARPGDPAVAMVGGRF